MLSKITKTTAKVLRRVSAVLFTTAHRLSHAAYLLEKEKQNV